MVKAMQKTVKLVNKVSEKEFEEVVKEITEHRRNGESVIECFKILMKAGYSAELSERILNESDKVM